METQTPRIYQRGEGQHIYAEDCQIRESDGGRDGQSNMKEETRMTNLRSKVSSCRIYFDLIRSSGCSVCGRNPCRRCISRRLVLLATHNLWHFRRFRVRRNIQGFKLASLC